MERMSSGIDAHALAHIHEICISDGWKSSDSSAKNSFKAIQEREDAVSLRGVPAFPMLRFRISSEVDLGARLSVNEAYNCVRAIVQAKLDGDGGTYEKVTLEHGKLTPSLCAN